ncbi:MAG: hypothetical protein LBQ10_12015 [Desulfovibrio sp.]|jgi:hypothetical protein|nr:hypothetical protein [Desulfovibrio sp.]
MWKSNVRPHGEYFAKAQAVTAAQVAGNQAENNPTRLDNSQGGTGIRVAVPNGGSLVLAAGTTLTLTVQHGATKTGAFTTLGTAVFVSPAAATTYVGDDLLCEFILPPSALPFIKVTVGASAAATSGGVDIFPTYISRPPTR